MKISCAFKRRMFYISFLLILILASPAFSMDGKALVEKHKCGSCHLMVGPSGQSIDEALARKAPDLFYAGRKFNRPWLLEFIQRPTNIRPAGVVYANDVRTVDGQDVVENAPVCKSKLSLDEANMVVDYLMTLQDADVKEGIYQKTGYTKFMLDIAINKQLACNACHRFPGGKGGVSGPTFEGIGQRLNPDWMVSFIKNPQAHDPWVWMPKYQINDQLLQQIVSYLNTME